MSKAIVVGGGPTGLATAMLLAKRGVEVVVLDREAPAPSEVDDLWENWERRSVAQFHQVHYLQPAAHAQLAAHLPEVLAQMSVAGVEEFNVPELQARHMSAGDKDVDLSRFVTRTSCRRPFMEFGFVSAARACPGVEIKSASPVTALVVGPEVIKGVPHVIGVKTENGDAYYADVIIDASGRRTALPALIASVGGVAPSEHLSDFGFVYNTRYYKGDSLPEYLGDNLAAVGSISLLTMPGDHGHWSATVYHSPQDKAMRKVRDPEVFERVIRSMPLHAQWVDGEPVSDVYSMAASANTVRDFFVDGRPSATGLVPIGDAWGFTNPSLGRGICLGLKHALSLADPIAANLDRPASLAEAWFQETQSDAQIWHTATVDIEKSRAAEVDALRQGLPDPFDSSDVAAAFGRAFASASHYDLEVKAWYNDLAGCYSLPMEVISRPGVMERILEVAASHPQYQTPGPNREELESLLK
jgi:2-polyprenyl-6-methoxyphenol hydroxylase-like FAD-dependent oxidoreductase